MKITVQRTSHAEYNSGETERMDETFTIELKRNGQARDAFLRNVAAHIRSLAAAYNAKFDEEHGISQS